MKQRVGLPERQGLYDPQNEHDACGVGMVIHIKGDKSHEIVESGLQVLEHMAHRGAEGADSKTGDGAGMLVQIPHEYILLQGIPVPEKGKYGTGLVFLPQDQTLRRECEQIIGEIVQEQGLTLMHWRDVPTDNSILGGGSLAAEPVIRQLFVTCPSDASDLERRLYVVRKYIENEIARRFPEDPKCVYIVSLSSRTITYKGMLSSDQLRHYFRDLTAPYFTSAIALVHSRFSTNTFPTWDLAQPFRLIGHNGEINTIRGNRAWMETRESLLHPEGLGEMKRLSPIVQPGMSDSASLDNVLEFLVMSGMSLPHALAMLIPESWNRRNPISPALRAFYEYHSIWMEPWDGPVTLMFSDGRYAGGMLDRNGLRPARYLVMKNDVMIVASETGVVENDPSQVREKGRLRPGKLLIVDTQEGKIFQDEEIKEQLAREFPYQDWLEKNRVILENVKSGRKVGHSVADFGRKLRAFGYHREDIDKIITPMAAQAVEPLSAMGNDTPLAVLSARPQNLFSYFRQQFAQVTNPPIDPLREELVMSATSYIGAIGGNILEPRADFCKVLKIFSPVLTNTEIDILRHLGYKGFRTRTIDMVYDVSTGAAGIEKAIRSMCQAADQAVDDGINYVILSDRAVDNRLAPVPSLMALSAVNHALVRAQKRSRIALIIETGEAREVMHIALLTGFGASAVNPYMAFAVLDDLVKQKNLQLDYETAEKHYVKAVNKGMMKIISKMGISTIRSYRGAQLFDVIGLSSEILDRYFPGISSKIEGATLADIAGDLAKMHADAFTPEEIPSNDMDSLDPSGDYAYRKNGEFHAWNPKTISLLQKASRSGDYAQFKEFTTLVDGKEAPIFLRDLMRIKKADKPVDISLVEPVAEILKRFTTGAMSFGSISREAHEAMAIAMNEIGGKSNTGEGGEDPARYLPRPDGTSARSAIKQVASGRFGVTAQYLVNADEIQIKVAQGAKPGEGGQLPGYKVDEMVARTRHSIPGISLISPPPHHDIYSIEDLAQLIFDMKNINPRARISVKLVAESGVGTVAAGVAKAKADMILISGSEGGTGASPAGSIRHAGLPPEIGLSEAQQTLVLNNLRGQVSLQVDGQLKTGRDIVTMALLGAEEYGFSTAALIVLGCIMDRKCHRNTCPVGIATQCEEQRKKYKGEYNYLVNYFTFLAEEVRECLAEMGFTRLDEIIGRTDLLESREDLTGKAAEIDLSHILYRPCEEAGHAIRKVSAQHHALEAVLDQALIAKAAPALQNQETVRMEFPIHNTDRAAGVMLSGRVTEKYGAQGLAESTIHAIFKGSAGQSFGAFLCPGIRFDLEGDANDYLGKGLSGGRIVVTPPKESFFSPEENIIAGNTLLYGATSGEVYINGRVGERFCVRNSGATAIVEGTGDHCCEYMTGGRAVVLGPTGRNFAAGMSGGIAYVWNPEEDFDFYCNMDMVELSLIEESADEKELHELISSHYYYTGSPLARRILDNWKAYVGQFIKVMPIEYKKVLYAQRLAELERRLANVERDY